MLAIRNLNRVKQDWKFSKGSDDKQKKSEALRCGFEKLGKHGMARRTTWGTIRKNITGLHVYSYRIHIKPKLT